MKKIYMAVMLTAILAMAGISGAAENGLPTAALPKKSVEIFAGFEYSLFQWSLENPTGQQPNDTLSAGNIKVRTGLGSGITATLKAPYILRRSMNSYYPDTSRDNGFKAPTALVDKSFEIADSGYAWSLGLGYQGYDQDMLYQLDDAALFNIAGSVEISHSTKLYSQYRLAMKTADAKMKHVAEFGMFNKNLAGSHAEIFMFLEKTPSGGTVPVTYESAMNVGGGFTAQILLTDGLYLEPQGRAYFYNDRTMKAAGSSSTETGYGGFMFGLGLTTTFGY